MDYTQRLQDLREDNDLTLDMIAKDLGMNREQYRRYEKGIHEIKISFLIKICQYYNVSSDYILGFTNDIKPLPKK